jgi:hypothetical protein
MPARGGANVLDGLVDAIIGALLLEGSEKAFGHAPVKAKPGQLNVTPVYGFVLRRDG